MFEITPYNKIKLSWGDNAAFGVDIVDLDDKEYMPTADDILQLSVYDDTIRIQREADIVDGRFVFSLDSQDVADMPVGYYTYVVKLLGEDTQYTVVKPSIFELIGDEPQDQEDEEEKEKDES